MTISKSKAKKWYKLFTKDTPINYKKMLKHLDKIGVNRMESKNTIYIVQESITEWGVGDPFVFLDKNKAEEKYLELFNKHENHSFKEYKTALDYIRKNGQGPFILFFECEAK